MDGVHTSAPSGGVDFDSLVVKSCLTSRMEQETVGVGAGSVEAVILCRPF
jgi:hypothetical protein